MFGILSWTRRSWFNWSPKWEAILSDGFDYYFSFWLRRTIGLLTVPTNREVWMIVFAVGLLFVWYQFKYLF